jgi:hypothetical protein
VVGGAGCRSNQTANRGNRLQLRQNPLPITRQTPVATVGSLPNHPAKQSRFEIVASPVSGL